MLSKAHWAQKGSKAGKASLGSKAGKKGCLGSIIVQYINDHHDVEGLCREFPDRLQAVVDNEGDRINK